MNHILDENGGIGGYGKVKSFMLLSTFLLSVTYGFTMGPSRYPPGRGIWRVTKEWLVYPVCLTSDGENERKREQTVKKESGPMIIKIEHGLLKMDKQLHDIFLTYWEVFYKLLYKKVALGQGVPKSKMTNWKN
jgi:hypothetical protein